MQTRTQKLILILVVLALCFPGVFAVSSVSFADPDDTFTRDILLYNSTGALLGTYNTTTTGIELPADESVMFMIKPQYSNPLDDPGTFLSGAIGWFQTNALTLLILAAMGGLLFKRF